MEYGKDSTCKFLRTSFRFMFTTAKRTFTTAERTFATGERTFRSGEHKTEAYSYNMPIAFIAKTKRVFLEIQNECS